MRFIACLLIRLWFASSDGRRFSGPGYCRTLRCAGDEIVEAGLVKTGKHPCTHRFQRHPQERTDERRAGHRRTLVK